MTAYDDMGAVITDASGGVVSAGRNRITESTGPAGHLFGSRLAHAEMDALAGLPGDNEPDLVLWTTLEPCLLCAGGIVARTYARDDPQLLDHARAHARTAAELAADHASARDAFATLAG